MIIFGTPCFKHVKDAYNYYSKMRFTHEDVDRKIKNSEIYIGHPLKHLKWVSVTDRVWTDADNRYMVEQSNKEA